MRSQPTQALGGLILALWAAPAVATAQPAAQPAEPPPADAPIQKVLVLSDRAQITREARVPCREGGATARFFPLPLTVQGDSVHAQGVGQAQAVGTAQRQRTLDAALDPRAEALQVEIEQLNDQLIDLHSRQQVLQSRGDLARQYGDRLVDAINGRMLAPGGEWGLSAWGQGLDQLKAEHTARGKASLALATQIREVRRTLQRRQRALQRLQSGAGRTAVEVVVSATCKGPEARLQLSYIVSGAAWRPEYDLRFIDKGRGKGQVELTVGAIIQQQSGEDWTQAQITLSSAKPRLGGEAPRPAPLQITGGAAGKDKVLVQAQERRETLKAGEARRDSGPASASLDDKGQSVTLTLPRRVDIAADGRPYWVPVDVRSAKATAYLSAVPKLSDRVWRKVRFDNPAPYPLMAGRLHVFNGGDYVGDTDLRHRGPGAPTEVALGVDEGFKVERKAANEQTRNPGLFQSAKKMERAYEIEITRTAGGPAELEVTESLPISRVDQVKVSLDREGTTGGFSVDEDRGFITWPLKLSANEKQRIKLGYTIRLPDDWKVQ